MVSQQTAQSFHSLSDTFRANTIHKNIYIHNSYYTWTQCIKNYRKFIINHQRFIQMDFFLYLIIHIFITHIFHFQSFLGRQFFNWQFFELNFDWKILENYVNFLVDFWSDLIGGLIWIFGRVFLDCLVN
jgi:hypothetical protein